MDSREWKEFIVGDLFLVEKGKTLTKENQISGNLPFITATTFNNGVGNNISNEIKTWVNAITVASNGEPGISFYHPYEFSASGDVCVLSNNNLNKHTGVFLCTCIERLKANYSYGKKLGKERLSNEKIWLPVKNSEPDYEFMERYINTLNFSEILR